MVLVKPAILHQCLPGGSKRRRRGQSKLAACKTLARHRQSTAASLLLTSQLSVLATAAAARLEGRLDAALPLATSLTPSEALLISLLSSMPELYDDQDEVGTGLYVLIGCAAVTVVLMYSWIGFTLYQGFKARRKVD